MEVLKLAVSKHLSERCIKKTMLDIICKKHHPVKGFSRVLVPMNQTYSATLVPQRPAVSAGFRCYTRQPGGLHSAQGNSWGETQTWKKTQMTFFHSNLISNIAQTS